MMLGVVRKQTQLRFLVSFRPNGGHHVRHHISPNRTQHFQLLDPDSWVSRAAERFMVVKDRLQPFCLFASIHGAQPFTPGDGLSPRLTNALELRRLGITVSQ
jgi:hypothetical protein